LISNMTSSKLKQQPLETRACHGRSSPPDTGDDARESIARVTAVDRGQYVITSAQSEVPAKLTGRTLYASESPVDRPCVGDWVRVCYHDAGAHASILEVLPRTSFLRRKKPGSGLGFQMIAANIDVAFIVQSCERSAASAEKKLDCRSVSTGPVPAPPVQ
jgi:ribosome biogenesis GTPase